MAGKLKKEKQKVYLSPGNLKRKMIPRIFFMSYLGINVIALTGIPVYASDIFATAKNAMQTVYTDVAGIAIQMDWNWQSQGTTQGPEQL